MSTRPSVGLTHTERPTVAREVAVRDELQRFVHRENIAYYRKLIAKSERDPSHDNTRHKMLLQLLADELAKDHREPKR